MRILLAAAFFTSMISQASYAAEPNWQLVVVFNQVDIGGYTRATDSYDLVWIRKDSQKSALIKQLKDTKRAANEGTKNKFSTLSRSTSGSPYGVVFEYSVMKPMWKGPDKAAKGYAFKVGKYVGQIQSNFRQSKSAEKYSNIKIVEVIDMAAAKEFLNNPKNKTNPYIGRIPTSVKGSPCDTDLWSESCKTYQESQVSDPSAIGVRG